MQDPTICVTMKYFSSKESGSKGTLTMNRGPFPGISYLTFKKAVCLNIFVQKTMRILRTVHHHNKAKNVFSREQRQKSRISGPQGTVNIHLNPYYPAHPEQYSLCFIEQCIGCDQQLVEFILYFNFAIYNQWLLDVPP